jgi:cell division protein FtsZ
MAVESPLLETTVNGATDVIINISGDISLADASDAASFVQEQAGEDVNIIFGAMYDDSNTDACDVTVIATGIGNKDVISPNTIFGTAAGRGSSPYGRDLKTGYGEQLRNSAGSYNRSTGNTVRQKNLEIPSFLRTKR